MEGLRNELIANMSHDLRTPLTMISGYGEMMRDIPGENNAENVQVIIDEANRLDHAGQRDPRCQQAAGRRAVPGSFCL